MNEKKTFNNQTLTQTLDRSSSEGNRRKQTFHQQGLDLIFSKEGSLTINIYEWKGIEIFGRDKKTLLLFYDI